jgi:hypothetical protein
MVARRERISAVEGGKKNWGKRLSEVCDPMFAAAM